MANIIRSWSLNETVEASIIKILEDNAITDDNIADLTEDLIKELIPPIGLRIEFLKRRSATYKLGKVSDHTNPNTQISQISSGSISSEETTTEAYKLQKQDSFTGNLSFALRTKTINLKQILSENVQGKAVLQSYKKTKYLSRKNRMLIVDVILTDLLNEIAVLTNNDFVYLSEEIVKLFPTENSNTYFIPPVPKNKSKIGKSLISRGRLVDKYRNKLRELKTIHEWKPPGGSQHTANDSSESYCEEVPEVILEAKTWLQSHSMPWETVREKWTLTSEYRRKNISSNRSLTLGQIFEIWPILKQPDAHSLIEDDFVASKLPTQDLNAERWKEFFAQVLVIRPTKKEDNNATALLELIDCGEINENATVVAQLRLLPHLLPPKSRKRRQKSQWKPSIPEAKDSIVIYSMLLANITQIQENRRKRVAELGITLQPFIIAVGPSTGNITDLFISADNTLYKVPSALKAIDLCFKIFHVFDIEYPIESAHIWLLIQRYLYGYASASDTVTPGITEVISDLLALRERNT